MGHVHVRKPAGINCPNSLVKKNVLSKAVVAGAADSFVVSKS